MKMNSIKIQKEKIRDFCQRNNIKKMSLFGSALRGEMTENSDVDILVEFLPETNIGLIKLAGLEIELSAIIGEKVDLRTPADLSRYFRDDVVREAKELYFKDKNTC